MSQEKKSDKDNQLGNKSDKHNNSDKSVEQAADVGAQKKAKKRKKPSRQILRHNARSAALQALYGWSFHKTSGPEYLAVFLEEHKLADTDVQYFKELLLTAIAEVDNIDKLIAEKSSLPIADLNPIELAGLRLAAVELMHNPEVPYKVVINESLNLNKVFGSEQGFRFVNGVLDKLAKSLRPNG